MKVNIKLLHEGKMPTKAHPEDAGMDCYARSISSDDYGNVVYDLGFSIEIPKGYVGLIFPRSSVSKYGLFLRNSVGVIDSNYRGTVMAKFGKIGQNVKTYMPGERVCQLIIMPYPEIELNQVEELSDSDRQDGGFGSSGK